MFPLRDNIPSRTWPVVNVSLIVCNLLIFLYEVSLGRHLQDFLMTYGVVPAKVLYLLRKEPWNVVEIVGPFFTSMFLHGGWMHVIGNMWFLWIFGDNVEDRLGHFRYLVFYLLCGLVAGLVHYMLNPTSGVPTVGASGAIAGVMGAYYLLYPRARVLTLVPLFFFVEIIEIPAFFFLGLWFVIQLVQGAFSLATVDTLTGGVAWWAHVGGFAAGAVLVNVFKRRTYRRFYRDEYWPW
ncbi:MAG: rhomboid family intramembrane serine protease [candidate division KSB1 bacterium]|nr:rhomboid family intramembrane serine protease [candidate division KSB1 bacterium]